MKRIISNIRKLVTPSKSEEKYKADIADEILNRVIEETDGYSEIKNIELGGSYPKSTWLPQSADIDIFIKFDPKVSKKRFSRIIIDIGKKALDKYEPYLRYSDHPYVEAIVRDTKVNVVPCYMVKQGMWQSAADRSQFHTEFMKKNLTPLMKSDVRILKKFLQCARIYGAEISTQGLSGYVAEVLVYNYGSFEKIIEAMAHIKRGHVIGNASEKFDTPITIMDPIDSKRNLAAAISIESMGKFVLLCRTFLAKPSASFFKSRNLSTKSNALENCVMIKFRCKDRSADTVWGQLKKAASSLALQLEGGGFTVVRYGASSDYDKKMGALLYFMLESVSISNMRTRKGPSFFNKDDSLAFISKNIKKSLLMWVDSDENVRILEHRRVTNATEFLKHILRSELVKSGVPKDLWPDIKNGFTINASSKAIKGQAGDTLRGIVATDEKIFSAY
ncbi:MAG: CCA-adding enzyme [Cenarchaeum symbiont of Oopsacas minuta]|nr:CCA-adding enzyme [Cenarchaeum symbiont of Oopsacas minuta]